MFSEDETNQENHETDVNNYTNNICDANNTMTSSNSLHSIATTSSSIDDDHDGIDIRLQHCLHQHPQHRQSNNKKDNRKKKRNSSLHHDSSIAKRNYYKSNFRNSMVISNNDTIFSLDELIVNYKDVCVYGRDLRLFEEDGEWINDTCINFHLKHIEGVYTRHDDDILLMDPAVISFFMHQCDDDDEMNDFAAGYNDFRYPIRRVFIPINDTMKPSTSWQTAGLGTHWSILLMIIKNEKKNRNEINAINNHNNTKDDSLLDRSYCIIAEEDIHNNNDNEVDVVTLQFYHYDSISNSMNHIVARSVAWKWSLLLLMRLGSIDSRDKATKLAGGGVKEVNVMECHVPNQKNGYDCGIHVLITIESLLYHNTYEDYIIQQQQEQDNEDDDKNINDMRITTNSNRNDRQNSITIHDIMSTKNINQQKQHHELKNNEDDDNDEYFYKYGVNHILLKTLQINSDYCRTVRNRIATNIRYLVKTSTTTTRNNNNTSLLESDYSNDDIDDPNMNSSDDNFVFSELDNDDDSDVEEENHDKYNYC